MNLVEAWFSVAERQAIHRGTYTSVKDLNAKIRAYIDGWNNRAHPFNWTKTADQILTKANRQKISNAEQQKVGVTMDQEESYLVARLQESVCWAGRYPIPKGVDEIAPRETPQRDWASPGDF
jgi:hypothetical protein